MIIICLQTYKCFNEFLFSIKHLHIVKCFQTFQTLIILLNINYLCNISIHEYGKRT